MLSMLYQQVNGMFCFKYSTGAVSWPKVGVRKLLKDTKEYKGDPVFIPLLNKIAPIQLCFWAAQKK